MRSPRAWNARLVRGGVLAGCAAVVLGSVWWLLGGDLERISQIAGVAGLFVTLAALAHQLHRRPTVPVDEAALLGQALEGLAVAVKAQWTAEVDLRELRRPAPIRVSWKTTRRPVAAPVATVAGDAIVGRPIRLRLHGHLGEVAEKFQALRYRRLAVLGEPGGGKTVLAMLLILRLLQTRQAGSEVPVLLGLASWDPTAKHLHTWISHRLEEDYPALRRRIDGVTVAERLVTSGRVLPVLDGLDELPERLHATAIRELDHARAGQPVILTCRSREYEQAVATDREVLTRAAVVELEPVTVAEAIDFLIATADVAAARWSRVAAALRSAPDGPLAAALSTPLMVALARTVYAAPGRDPGELMDLAEADGQAAVEHHLLEGFVPAAFSDPPPAPGTRSAHPSWDPERARRYLTLLATHLRHQENPHNLAWWELVNLVPQRVDRLVFGLSAGLAAGLALWFVSAHVAGFAAGFIGGLVAWLTGVPAGRLPRRPTPTRVSIQPRHLAEHLARSLTSRVRVMVVVGLILGLVVGVVVGLATPAGLVGGLVAGFAGVAAGVLAVVSAVVVVGTIEIAIEGRLQRPVDDEDAVTPRSALGQDRTVAVTLMLTVGFVFGSFWLVIGLLSPYGAVGWFAGALIVGLWVGSTLTAWAQFTVARVWLAVRGQLPWRLMTFLEVAHLRGVLRRAGAVYQFRHARLQDHLADAGATPTS